MSGWWIAALVCGWALVGAWTLCRVFRYEADLTVGDAAMAVFLGALLGPLCLIPLLFVWEDHRKGGPVVLARKIRRRDRDDG